MLKMVDGTGIIGVDMVCPLGGAVSPPQPPNYDNVEMEGMGSLTLQNSLKAPLERLELIGNSMQGENPAPDNPQEIKSAGRKSKNLLNFKDTSGTKNGINYIYKNGIITLNGTSSDICVLPSTTIPIVAGDYTISGRSEGAIVYGKVKNKSDETKYYTHSFTLEGNEKSCFIYPQIASGVTVNKVIKPMLNKGKTAEPFEPYSDGYLLDVKVTGKNLAIGKLYYCKYSRGTGYTDNLKEATLPFRPKSETVGVGYVVPCKKGVTYTFSVTNPNKNACLGITEYTDLNSTTNIEKNVGNRLKSKDHLTYTAIGNGVLLCFVAGVWTDGTTTLHECTESELLQLEIGNIPTPYEPYTEQSVQIALNEPLRGIRRINDGKNVQEALNSSGITRCFKRVEITKDTLITYTLGQYGAPETNTVLCRYKDASLKKAGAILCGELKNIDNWVKEEESVSMTEQGIDFRLSRERLGLGSNTTPEENKVAVVKYLTDHPLHCVAEINEPITEHLPESVQQQLQALHSENGTTHVFVDSGEVPCGIKLTYRKEK